MEITEAVSGELILQEQAGMQAYGVLTFWATAYDEDVHSNAKMFKSSQFR